MAKAPEIPAVDKKAKSLLEAVTAAMTKAKSLKGPAIDPSIIVNTKGAHEVIKGNQKPSFIWVWSPAQLQMNVTATKRLLKLSQLLGAAVNRVGKVRAAHQPGTKIVYIWPAEDDDPDAYEVLSYGGANWINLVDFLAPRDLTVDTGFKESFSLEFTQEGDPVYPALKFDMEKRKDRRLASKKKKEEETPAPSEPPKS